MMPKTVIMAECLAFNIIVILVFLDSFLIAMFFYNVSSNIQIVSIRTQ